MNNVATETEKKFCSDAIFVQDACNLCAVVNSFSRHISDMRKESGLSWDEIDNHPASQLFTDKIASMTGMQNLCGDEYTEKYAKAYQFCKACARE